MTCRQSADPELESKAAGGEAICGSSPASCLQWEQVVPVSADDPKSWGQAARPRVPGHPPVPGA